MKGKELRQRRKAIGYDKRKEFANAIDAPVETIRGWENERRKVPNWVVKMLILLENGQKLPKPPRR